jgi:hypothetical protein
MLLLKIYEDEFFDEEEEVFFSENEKVLRLEHSLVSMSKWESKYNIPFLGSDVKTAEQVYYYISCMSLDGSLDDNVLLNLSQRNLDSINEYIESPQSATTFGMLPEKQGRRGETITSELIYYWLVAFNIPFCVETWNLNRLFALIRICNIKNSDPKKMSRHEIASRNRQLNSQRRAQLGTSG